jgi:hypothetical protein
MVRPIVDAVWRSFAVRVRVLTIAALALTPFCAGCDRLLGIEDLETIPPDNNYVQTVLADAPVAFWRFEESTGPVIADSSGNENNAGVDGARLGLPGALGGGLTCDGASAGASATLSGAEDWGPAATLETWAWIDPEEAKGAPFVLLGKAEAIAIRYEPVTKQLIGQTNTTAAWPDYAVSTSGLTLAMWHHIVLTVVSERRLEIYVDGVLKVSDDTTLPSSGPESGTVRIGWGTSTEFYLGKLDEIAIYNHPIPRDRVEAHFTAAELLRSESSK